LGEASFARRNSPANISVFGPCWVFRPLEAAFFVSGYVGRGQPQAILPNRALDNLIKPLTFWYDVGDDWPGASPGLDTSPAAALILALQ